MVKPAGKTAKRKRYGARQLFQIGKRFALNREENAQRKAVKSIVPLVRAKTGIELAQETLSRLKKKGNLNYSYKATGSDGKKYLVSIARRNPAIMRSIMQGYVAFGLNPRAFGFRSMREQHHLMELLRVQGFQVPKVLARGANYMVREFCEGIPLNEFLASRPLTPEGRRQTMLAVSNELGEIIRAHSKGIVLGDRDGTNTIIRNDGSALFFDFDIKHWAKNSPEFETAQAMYFSIRYAADKQAAIDAIAETFNSSQHKKNYSLHEILDTLQRRGQYYRNNPELGMVEKEIGMLVERLKAQA